RGVFQERARDRGSVGDHADALLGRVRAHRGSLVFPPPPALLLVRHRSQPPATRVSQDALARTRALRGRLARPVALVEGVLAASAAGCRAGRATGAAGAVPEKHAPRRAGSEDPRALKVDGTISPLLQPLELGSLQLRNRIVMAPMTRSRALAGDVPG